MSQMSNEVRGQIERATVRATLAHLAKRGWLAWRTWDGETWGKPLTDDDVMALTFNLDEVSIRFVPTALALEVRKLRALPKDQRESGALAKLVRQCESAEHGVLVILGNTFDTISDWNYKEGDPDGFNAAMEQHHKEWERWQTDLPYLLRKLTQADRIALLCRAHRQATHTEPRFIVAGEEQCYTLEDAKRRAELHLPAIVEIKERAHYLPVIFVSLKGPRYIGHAEDFAQVEAMLKAQQLHAGRISLAECDVMGWKQKMYAAHS